MRTLCEDQAKAFEDHYVVCAACAGLLQDTSDYVDTMRSAAKELSAVATMKAAGQRFSSSALTDMQVGGSPAVSLKRLGDVPPETALPPASVRAQQ